MIRPARDRVYIPLALAMMAFVVLFERWALGLSDGAYFSALLARHGWWASLPRVAGVFALGGAQVLFFWASFASSRPWRVAYLVAFTLVTFLEYGYVRATGSIASALDFLTITENVRLWGPMTAIAVNWWAAVQVVVYAAMLAMAPPGGGRSRRRAAAVVSVTVALHLVYAGAGAIGREQRDVVMANTASITGTMQAFDRSAIMFVWNELADRMHPARQLVRYRDARVPSVHVVFVIDESVRADHLSLNGYARPTTPWLDGLQRAGRLVNWGTASSAGISSDPSVLSLLSGVPIPDPRGRRFTQPTIFAFAKAMNYHTHLFDGQSNQPRYGITRDDLGLVDDDRGVKTFGDDVDTDFRMAAAVRQLLQSPQGQFVVVLKRGDHIPYDRDYPPNARVWAPAIVTATLNHGTDSNNWADWVDSYDDGLRYNVDGFFKILLEADGSLSRTVVLYTSDHGQPYHPVTDAELRTASGVPLLMFGDARPAVDRTYRASHQNLFPTLLDLMGVPPDQRVFSYGRSLLVATGSDHDPRLVLEGDPSGGSAYSSRDFDLLPAPPIIR